MKKAILAFFGILLLLTAFAQSENIIIVTADGLRWQEVFKGMDESIAKNKKFHEWDSSYIFKNYWNENTDIRRNLLLPFFWQKIATEGQLYGNRTLGNKVDVANPYWFSYPGYNEIFTGFADTLVNSNEYPPNPNINLLEYLNAMPKYKNSVAAFGAWNAFDRILNEKRSKMQVVCGFDTVAGKKLTYSQHLINKMLLSSYKPWLQSECLDVFTHFAAMEYLKTNKPKVLFIGYGETDEWAHGGKYRSYLDAANQVDKWIAEIWNYLQSEPQYKNKTTLFITTDHGRGLGNEWTDHGSGTKASSQTWFAVLGSNVKAKGEIKQEAQFYNKQFAQTISHLLGLQFKANHPIGEKIAL